MIRRPQSGPTRHVVLPDIPTGYPLSIGQAWASVIVPEATTNLFTNPSFETGTTGWTTEGAFASLTRTAAQQVRGAFSVALGISVDATYAEITGGGATITNGTQYAISGHVRRPGGGPVSTADVRLIVNGGTVAPTLLEYVGNGWWRFGCVFKATTTDAVGFRVIGRESETWYLDALQLEAKSYHTTYCDGDELGLLPFESPAPYVWNGTPHASSSTRSAATRAGGRVYNLDRYGLTLVTVVGLGAGPVTNVATPLGNAPGSIYQTTEENARAFTLGGRIQGGSHAQLAQRRSALARVLGADLTGQPQPLRLVLQKVIDGRAIGDQVYADCSYAEGLEGGETGLYAEDVSIQFEQWQPGLVRVASQGGTIGEGSGGTAVFRRLPSGTWSNILGFNAGAERNALIYGADGRFYIGGSFTTPGTRVVAYNPLTSAIETLGSGLPSTVNALLYGPDGVLYAGGNFTISGQTGGVASWNGTNWSVLGGASGFSGTAYALAWDFTIGATGALKAAGTSGGNAALRAYAGAAWNNLLTAATVAGTIYDLAVDPRTGITYIGGTFANLNGVAAADNIAQITASLGGTVSGLGSGANDVVWSVTVDQQSAVYASGEFTTIGGAAADGLAVWNGVQWRPMANVENNVAIPTPSDLWYDRYRQVVWITSAYDLPFDAGSSALVGWRNGAVRAAGGLFPVDVITGNNTDLLATITAGGVFGAGGVTSVTYQGTIPRGPIIVGVPILVEILGGGQVIVAGVTAGSTDRVLVDVEQLQIRSVNVGDLTFGIQQQSTPVRLLPGANNLIVNAVSPTTLAYYVYPAFRSLDDTVPQ